MILPSRLQNCLRYGRCAVLAIITGEEQAFDWSRNRPSGLDLAAEGLVVATIQSRTNIFGWLTTGHAQAPGNLGLRDQQLALRWLQVNVAQFGGTAERVTLLGHGTAGAANAMLHWTTRTARSASLFAQLILMSGTVHSPWSFQVTRNAASTSLSVLRNLACESPQPAAMLACVRQKSAVDLLRAFENVHQNGNYTRMLGAEVDRYLPDAERWLLRDPRKVIEAGAAATMPMLVGLCSNEGAFVREQWLELAREGYGALWAYVQGTLIPNALQLNGFGGTVAAAAGESVRETIQWRYFELVPKTVPGLLAAMQRFQSEVRFERPFYEMLEQLIKERPSGSIEAGALVAANDSGIMEHRSALLNDDDNVDDDGSVDSNTDHRKAPHTQPSSLFVYSFQQPGTIDLRGRPNYFGGAAHTADLLFLMGPSLYQQIGRRRLTVTEEKLCKRMRQTFADFVKTGNPTPGRLFDAWHPYSARHRYVQVLGQPAGAVAGDAADAGDALHQNRAQIAELLGDDNGDEVTVTSDDLALNPYAIGRRKIDAGRQAKNYRPDGEPTDSVYALHMERVHAFWADRLPRMYKRQLVLLGDWDGAEPDNERQANGGGVELAAKFRHAFFAMLALVCVLLAMLGVCVYMLRRGHRGHIDTSYL